VPAHPSSGTAIGYRRTTRGHELAGPKVAGSSEAMGFRVCEP